VAERRALLIGVPHCDDVTFDDMGAVVQSDVRAMRDALAPSGFDVVECGIDDAHGGASPNRINKAIKTASADVPEGGVLLIYFSGHGVTIDGQDYLVPSDAYRTDDGLVADSLVPLIPASSIAACRARVVIFFVDACRNDPTEARPAGKLGGQLPFTAGGDVVLVMGCGPGQVCHHTESGSVFTQALAQVLDHRHPARSLSQVLEAVTKDMRRKSRLSGLEQVPDVRYPAVLDSAGSVVICDGDELTAAWRKAIDKSALWELCGDTVDAKLVERVRNVVDNCARQCGAARATLLAKTDMKDHWTDQNYPGRVLRNTELLLAGYPGMQPGEAAILIAAPFLREAVFAAGIREAASVEPGNLRRTYRTGPRSDLELTHEMYQHVVRRAEGLERRHLAEHREQLAMWLVHQWLASRVNLWDSPAAIDACQLGCQLVQDCKGDVAVAEEPMLVQALLLAIGAQPVDNRLVDKLSGVYVDDRWRGFAAVLWLAGIMAADLRRMPTVIPDLIGTRMELPLTQVQDAAGRTASWHRSEDSLDLHLICAHPAMHDAFENIVRHADKARYTIGQQLTLPPAVRKQLPRRFTADNLRSETKSNHEPAYEVPLSRFQVAEDKVRELLMGKQLYDDPALAIRELYQNALDACRWRQTRHEWLTLKRSEPAPWEGHIRFRQGIDEDGRNFIECEDNGVGMDINTLKHVFANAGERFVYGQDYRAEQAEWQDHRPPLRMVSNSQFGVGVFSYFMLADEITVVTRHVRKDGTVEQEALEVHISSSGSLFQITPSASLPGGGTRVTLYLTGDEEDISVLRTLRRLLWIAEHRVEATEGDSGETWEPSELRYQDESAVSLRYRRDLWWVSGEGGLAADGISTGYEIFGLIVNLRDERRPQFTVDRKTLRVWDKGWVTGLIDESLPDLMRWPGFTLTWLWEVAESRPEIAQQIFRHAVAADHSIRIGAPWGHSSSVRATQAGCFPQDTQLFEAHRRYYHYARWFFAWRAGTWSRLVATPAKVRASVPAANTAGFPVPDPIDAEVFGRLDMFLGDEPPTVDSILLALAHQDQTATDRLRMLRRYAITGLDLTALRRVPPIDSTFRKEDAPLIRALAAWTPPGEPPCGAVAGPLVQTSRRLDQPLGEVLRRARGLAPPGWSAPELDLKGLAGYTGTTADATLLSLRVNRDAPWIQGDLPPSHLVAVSDDLGRPVEEVVVLCDRLAPLGVTVASRDSYPDDLGTEETEALRQVSAPGQRLSLLQLVLIAGHAGISLGTAHRNLARLERRGLLVRPELNALVEFAPTVRDLEFIEQALIVPLYRRLNRQYLKEDPWVQIIIYAAHRSRQRSKLYSSARGLIPFTAPGREITPAELVEVAYYLDCTLADARAAALEVYPEAQVSPLTNECEELKITPWEIHDTLLGNTWKRTGIYWRLGPGDIVEGALESLQPLGDYLSLLDPFRKLGAPVPAYDEAIRAALNETEVDEYDQDLLTVFDEWGDESYLRTVTALDLIRAAGRLGWTLARTHQRLAALIPVGLALDYPQVELRDEIVRWQDLLLLTRHLDGQAPALTGQVDEAHLTAVAAETGESVAWLRGRLALYAPLLRLDPAGDGGHAR
jgi:hypothetical protein